MLSVTAPMPTLVAVVVVVVLLAAEGRFDDLRLQSELFRSLAST